MSSFRNTLTTGFVALVLGGTAVTLIPTTALTASATPTTAVDQPLLSQTPQPFWRAAPNRALLTPTSSLITTAQQIA